MLQLPPNATVTFQMGSPEIPFLTGGLAQAAVHLDTTTNPSTVLLMLGVWRQPHKQGFERPVNQRIPPWCVDQLPHWKGAVCYSLLRMPNATSALAEEHVSQSGNMFVNESTALIQSHDVYLPCQTQDFRRTRN